MVPAKLGTAELQELHSLAERHSSGLCGGPENADVIVTAVSMRRRLERHVPWEVAVSTHVTYVATTLAQETHRLIVDIHRSGRR